MTRTKNNGPLAVNGFINLYKPPGITSMDALRRVKRITGQRKVGHGGTMDPLASGVLPVCFGQATRLMDYVVGSPKRYVMEVKLGVTTTTFDAEGEVVETKETSGLTRELVESTVQSFVGRIDQIPPMYSAIKFQGQRLYKLARAGIEVEREARPVDIHQIRIVDFCAPLLSLDVECGRGAYMRTLAADLGELLGCGAHVANLIRLSCGGFHIEESATLEGLEEAAAESQGWKQFVQPVDWVLKDLKSISVGRQAEEYLRNGQSINLGVPMIQAGYLEPFRAYNNEGRFLALVRFDRPGNVWRPVKVFHSDSVSPLAPVSSEA